MNFLVFLIKSCLSFIDTETNFIGNCYLFKEEKSIMCKFDNLIENSKLMKCLNIYLCNEIIITLLYIF